MAKDESEKRVYQQISQSADFYQPAVYDMLSFYQTLQTEIDPLSGQFIPLSTAQKAGSDQGLLFAVGLLPPAIRLTERILDRSATIGLSQPIGGQLEEENEQELPPEPNIRTNPDAAIIEEGKMFSPFGPRQNRQESAPRPHLGCDVAAPYGSPVRAAGDGVVISVSPDGVRHGYGNTIIIEHSDGRATLYAHLSEFAGGFSVGDRVSGGTVIGFVGQTSFPKIMQDQAHLHFEVLTRVVRGGANKFNGIVATSATPPRMKPQRWLASKGRALVERKIQTLDAIPLTADAPTSEEWVSDGAKNANKAAKTISQVSNTTLNASNLGKRFLEEQRAMIQMMRAALNKMADTPPLRLLVNPQSFRVSSEKIISDGNWGRNGHIIEHWGDNQDTIEGSGKIAAFYAMDVAKANANGPGLTRTARQFSQSYQNLLSLWMIYQNNGGIWFPDPIVSSGSKATNLSVVGSVYLYYDGALYIGSFNNFNLTEAETSPFTLEYSFNFTVRATFVLDHFDDRQYTYGRPRVPEVPTSSGESLQSGTGEQVDPDVPLPISQDTSLDADDDLGNLGAGFDPDDVVGG